MLLKVYQIYFRPEQKALLEKNYTPYYNENCTPYFESFVISKLIAEGAHTEAEYFGVVSYKLREKIGRVMKERWSKIPNIANHSIKEFTPEAFEDELNKQRPDVMSFQRHMPHDPVSFADQYHPNFSAFFKEIMNRLGFDFQPARFNDVFYCNYFVAKSSIYERFVTEMLAPAMEVMSTMPGLMGNSKYPQPLPADLSKKWGITWYPYHAFLCERMFSYFVHLNQYKCLHF